MSSPSFQFVTDANGNLVIQGSPPSFSGGSMEDQANDVFTTFNEGVNSTMRWATISSLGKQIKRLKFESLGNMCVLLVSATCSLPNIREDKKNKKKVAAPCIFSFCLWMMFIDLSVCWGK